MFGFEDRVDAEAGGIVVGWYLRQVADPANRLEFPFVRVAKAQSAMTHPLGRYLYFVHGYWGSNNDFAKLEYNFTQRSDFGLEYEIKYFDYFSPYGATNTAEKNTVHWTWGISHFALNLFYELNSLPENSQVNIVAHSLGGIIVREMLRIYRTSLEGAGILISNVITLGTPHYGTWIANPVNSYVFALATLLNLLPNADLWPSPVLWMVDPISGFLADLNFNPLSYSTGINWYTISGFDLAGSIALWDGSW